LSSVASILKQVRSHLAGEIIAVIAVGLAILMLFVKQIYLWLPLGFLLFIVPGIAYILKAFRNKSFIQLFIGVGLLCIFVFVAFMKIEAA